MIKLRYYWIIIPVVYILFFGFQPQKVLAEVNLSWLSDLHDCKSFGGKLEEFYFQVAAEGENSLQNHKEDLQRIRDQACSNDRFPNCHFEICQNISQTNSSEIPNEIIEKDILTEDVSEDKLEGTISLDQMQQVRARIVTDPFGWLHAVASCDQLTEQLHARFDPLGAFARLPREKQVEIRQVFSLTCTEEFEQCQFAGCAPVNGILKSTGNIEDQLRALINLTSDQEMGPFLSKFLVRSEKDPGKSEDQKLQMTIKTLLLGSVSEEDYIRTYQALVLQKNQKLKETLEQEKKLGVAWVRFVVNEEELQINQPSIVNQEAVEREDFSKTAPQSLQSHTSPSQPNIEKVIEVKPIALKGPIKVHYKMPDVYKFGRARRNAPDPKAMILSPTTPITHFIDKKFM